MKETRYCKNCKKEVVPEINWAGWLVAILITGGLGLFLLIPAYFLKWGRCPTCKKNIK